MVGIKEVQAPNLCSGEFRWTKMTLGDSSWISSFVPLKGNSPKLFFGTWPVGFPLSLVSSQEEFYLSSISSRLYGPSPPILKVSPPFTRWEECYLFYKVIASGI